MAARLLLLLLCLLGALAGVPAAASASAGSSEPAAVRVVSADSTASARAVRCRDASGSGMPSADFEGTMRAIPGTRRMSMRFQLQEHFAAGSWVKVLAPALRRWRRSSAGVHDFGFVQRIENLRLEGAYRVVVRFHWLDRQGRVIRSAKRASNACPAVEPFPLG
jgi:hypothetical protein